MSYTTLFGAFSIAPEGDDLDPRPNALVGEIHGSSRNGTLFRVVRELLGVLPLYGTLRFLAHEPSAYLHRRTDASTLWTVLDQASLPLVIAELDGLLVACHQNAATVGHSVRFGTDQLDAEQIRMAIDSAKECTRLNDEALRSEEGESADFVFAALVSLRGLLRRARAQSERVAIFTWSPD